MRLVELPIEPPAATVRPLADEEIVRAIVARLAGSRCHGNLTTADGLRLRVTLERAPEGELAIVPENGAETSLENAVQTRIAVYALYRGASFRLSATLQRNQQGFYLCTPIQVTSVSRRRLERLALQPGRALLEWQHPLNPAQCLRADVLDFSPSGVSILAPGDPTWLPPSPGSATWLRIDELAVPVSLALRRTESVGADGIRVGFSFCLSDERVRVMITRAYQKARCPWVGLRSEVASTSIEALMEESGYAALREGTDPVSGWHTPPGDERLTVDLVYRSPCGSAVGHFSCSRTYPDTWMFHQLATLPSERHQAAYNLYLLLIEWTLALARERAYAIAYFNQDKRWHRTLFTDFVQAVGSETLSVITSLDRLEHIAGSPAPASDPRVRVRPAQARDALFINDLARSMLPPLTADALYLHDHSIIAQTLCPEHAAAGLERARTALIVELDGQRLGAALCETGSRSLSLFNILNMAQVYMVADSSKESRCLAETALLSAILTFYAKRGVKLPLIVAPSGSVLEPESAGLVVVESMGLWAASKEGLQHWRNHVHLELGSRAARSRSHHEENGFTHPTQGSPHA